jgi:undecaprenyl-diphosphatase
VTVGPGGQLAPTAGDLQQLPHFSEKLDGSRQEPIGIVFIGTRPQLTSAFQAAGWQIADSPSLNTFTKAVVAAAANRPYPTAPVTPTFLAGAVQDIAFEKPEGAATVRRRHHVRFWQTSSTVRGVPVWVATASFDSRLEIGTTIPLPTHHIDPDIDAEQAYVVADLVRTGEAAFVARVSVTQPSTGTNAQGDAWFTQGYASVLEAKH